MEGDDASGAGAPPAPRSSGAGRQGETSCLRRAMCLGVAFALVLGATACRGGGRIVLPVVFYELAPALHYPGYFGSHEAVVRGVATLVASDLRLPVPDHVTVYIYSSRAVFERGLVSDGRHRSVAARRPSRRAPHTSRWLIPDQQQKEF